MDSLFPRNHKDLGHLARMEDTYIVLLGNLKKRHNMVVGVDRQIIEIEVDGVAQQRDGFVLKRVP